MSKNKKSKQLRHVVGGLTFYLKKLPAGTFLMAGSHADNKPVPPTTEVRYADGTVVNEVNRRDPKYLRDMGLWQFANNARMFRLCVVHGIDRVEHANGTPAHPTEDEAAEILFVYGDLPRKVIEHYWRADKIGDTAPGFMNLVMGQTEITEEGLAKDERRFRASRERSRVHGEGDGLPVTAEVEGSIPVGVREERSGQVLESDVDGVFETDRDE